MLPTTELQGNCPPPKVPIHWWCVTCYLWSPADDQGWKETLPWLQFGSHTGQSAGARFHAFCVAQTCWWLQPLPGSAAPQNQPCACCSISYTQHSPAPGALLYPRDCHSASQGSSQPQALHQGLFTAWVQVQQHRCTTECLGKQHCHMHPFPVLCAAVWCINICAHILFVFHYFILDIIYIQIYVHM